jgi:ribosomal protein S18 acetylase RimI-like enzyme
MSHAGRNSLFYMFVEEVLQCHDIHAEDEPFLFSLYVSTRCEEVAMFGWPEDQINVFLRSQYAAQRLSYHARYPNAENKLIRRKGEPVGRMIVCEFDNRLVLVDLALLKAFQCQGIGTSLIRRLKNRALEAGKGLELHVLQNSRGIHLYERLGFTVAEVHFPYQRMEWHPKQNEKEHNMLQEYAKGKSL